MSIFSSSATAYVVALLAFCFVVPLGAINPELAAPGIVALFSASLLFLAKQLVAVPERKRAFLPLEAAVLAFVSYSFICYFLSNLEYEARNELIQIVTCTISFFIASKGVRDRDGRRIFTFAVAIFALFQSCLGIWQSVTRSDFVFVWERPELYNGRGSGTLICPNHLAGFLEMALGMIVARAVITRKEGTSTERSVLIKVLLIYIAVMTCIGILFSLSRAGWASAIVGTTTLLLLGKWTWKQALARFGVVFAILLCAAGTLWAIEPVRNYLLKSIVPTADGDSLTLGDPTIGGRTLMWSGTIEMIKQHPWWGTGMGSWQWLYQKVKDYHLLSFPEYTHNDYLNLASDYGLVGFLLMLVVFVLFYAHAIQIVRTSQSSEDRAFAAGSIAGVTAILFHSWFDFNLHIFGNSVFLACIMGLTSGIPRNSNKAMETRLWVRWLRFASIVGALVVLTHLYLPTLRAYRTAKAGDAAKFDLAYDEALSLYTRSAEIDPRYPKPYIQAGDIYRDQLAWRLGPGKARERRELAEKAVASYERALSLNPYRSDVWLSRGRVFEQIGRLDDALQSYSKAIEVAPVSAYAHFVIGQYYRERGESQKAIEYFEKADRYFLRNDPMFQLSRWYEEEKLKDAPKNQ